MDTNAPAAPKVYIALEKPDEAREDEVSILHWGEFGEWHPISG